MQNSVQQSFFLNYTSRIPHLYKNVPPFLILLLASIRYGLPCPFPQMLLENLVNWGKSCPASKKFLTSRTSKILLTNQQFSCNHSIQIMAVVTDTASFFFNSGFMYTYILLTSINRWLLNLIFIMAKALNGQNSSPLFNVIWKRVLFLLFTLSLFPFKLYKFLLTPLQLLLHNLRANQI